MPLLYSFIIESKWCKFTRPVTKLSKAKPMQPGFTFNTKLKIDLIQVKLTQVQFAFTSYYQILKQLHAFKIYFW